MTYIYDRILESCQAREIAEDNREKETTKKYEVYDFNDEVIDSMDDVCEALASAECHEAKFVLDTEANNVIFGSINKDTKFIRSLNIENYFDGTKILTTMDTRFDYDFWGGALCCVLMMFLAYFIICVFH